MARAARDRAGEDRIGKAVLAIAASKSDGEVTISELKTEMSDYTPLTDHDLSKSQTRPGEPLFHQIIRNIVSHKNAQGNLISEGLLEHIGKGRYRLTETGRIHAAKRP